MTLGQWGWKRIILAIVAVFLAIIAVQLVAVFWP